MTIMYAILLFILTLEVANLSHEVNDDSTLNQIEINKGNLRQLEEIINADNCGGINKCISCKEVEKPTNTESSNPSTEETEEVTTDSTDSTDSNSAIANTRNLQASTTEEASNASNSDDATTVSNSADAVSPSAFFPPEPKYQCLKCKDGYKLNDKNNECQKLNVPKKKSSSGGLSGGAIVAIVIPSVIVVVGAAAGMALVGSSSAAAGGSTAAITSSAPATMTTAPGNTAGMTPVSNESGVEGLKPGAQVITA